MRKIYCLCILIKLAALLLAIAGHFPASPEPGPENPRRIVSLAPAITETLYSLELGDRIAGVTKFCLWPPQAHLKPKIGGFREVNLEAIARTNADLAILPADMAHFKKTIEDLGIPVMIFDCQSLEGFLEDMLKLGTLCGDEARAAELRTEFDRAMQKKPETERPSVLFAIMNPEQYNQPISELTAIGADRFYNEIIEAAGGRNAYDGKMAFPILSLESIIRMNPEIIVVAAPGMQETVQLEKQWRDIAPLKGVKGKRLLILKDAGDTIPGPRSLDTLKKIAQAIQAIKDFKHD